MSPSSDDINNGSGSAFKRFNVRGSNAGWEGVITRVREASESDSWPSND